MANTQALATSFKSQLFTLVHDFVNDTFYAALFLVSGSLGAATTAYSATSEVSGTNYTAGGVNAGTWVTPTTSGTTAYTTPSASITFSNVTLSTAFDTALIYNSSKSNKAIGVWTFGSQTVTAGDFVLTMPTNDSTHALIQLA